MPGIEATGERIAEHIAERIANLTAAIQRLAHSTVSGRGPAPGGVQKLLMRGCDAVAIPTTLSGIVCTPTSATSCTASPAPS